MKDYNISEIPYTMSRKECQNILKISKGTMLKLIKSKAITASVISGKYIITKDSLIEFIEKSIYQ